MAHVGSDDNEWVSINDSLEYIEIEMNDDINIDHIDELSKSMNNEEYILYLKSLWNKDRDNKQKMMNKQIYKNNQLQQQLNTVKKQNMKLQNELNFVNSKLKHQQNNNIYHNNNNNNNNINNEENVVTKLFNVFKSKNTGNNTHNNNQRRNANYNLNSLNQVNILFLFLYFVLFSFLWHDG